MLLAMSNVFHLLLSSSICTLLWANPLHGQGELHPINSTWNDHFGDAISSNGTWLAIGAPQDSSEAFLRGSVHIYREKFDSTWELHQRLSPNPVPGSGENIFFGTSVSINGNWLVVGAPGDDEVGVNAGAAHVYHLNVETSFWEETNKLFSISPATNDHLGTSVSIDESAGLAVVGQVNAFETGKLHPWLIEANTWTRLPVISNPTGETNAKFGLSIDLDGDTLIAGAPLEENGKGSVWIMSFDDVQNDFNTIARLQPNNDVLSPHFGTALDISGNTIIVGAPFDGDGETNGGLAYLFRDNGTGWIELDSFAGTFTEAGDAFGTSLHLAYNSVVVGAPFHSAEIGDAYVFDITGSTAVEIIQLLPHDGISQGYFGRSCHIPNDSILVSSLAFNHTELQTGKVYIYDSIVMFGDFDSDSDRDIEDLLILIASWGPCADYCSADLNLNGEVDIYDLLAFIQVW
jgi:hypothetical protein